MIPSAPTISLIAPVQWIVDLLHPVLLFFHDTIGFGWGMSIVLLTLVVRALLAPLTVKQFKSMQSMVRVAPELKALQAKHEDDKQRQQREVMKFYAQNKVNPFASCLPLLAQIPLFIGLFWLLQRDLRRDICGPAVSDVSQKIPCADVAGAINGAQDFLFIPDLTVHATGSVLVVLIVLYLGSQLLSSILTPATANRNQRLIMYGLPFVLVIFIQSFPAGLIVYWITTNLWTVAQGYVLRKRMSPVGAADGELALPDAIAPPAGARTATSGRAPAAAKVSGGGRTQPDEAQSVRSGPPPAPPRKKKKRSGRRR